MHVSQGLGLLGASPVSCAGASGLHGRQGEEASVSQVSALGDSLEATPLCHRGYEHSDRHVNISPDGTEGKSKAGSRWL